MTVRDDLRAQVETLRPDVEAVARAIHSEPETADEEHRAVARLAVSYTHLTLPTILRV